MKRNAEMEPLLINTQRRLGLDDEWTHMLMQVLNEPERSMEWLLSLSENRYRRGIPVVFVAAIFAGHVDIAFELAHQLVDNRQLSIEAMLISEASAFRRDDRFNGLARRVGLYDYWESTRWPAVVTAG